ncbi:MAG: hypothetical protein QXR45_14275 [Candidatus Bathyarchaeia archaeon]
MTIAQSYEFNIVENGSKWFKSRIFELILRYKPEIIQTFFPEFQVISLSSSLDSYIEPYMGKLPKGKLLALPSDVLRHVRGVERGLLVLELEMRYLAPLPVFFVGLK